jgi:CrcB protein
MTRWLIVAFGGALGSIARYVLSGLVQDRTTPYFPTGTFAVNAVGCFVVGVFAGAAAANAISPTTRLFLVVGVCGGFTTFSTFGYETFRLLEDGEFWLAGVNVGGQLIVGLVAVSIGLAIARRLWGAV